MDSTPLFTESKEDPEQTVKGMQSLYDSYPQFTK